MADMIFRCLLALGACIILAILGAISLLHTDEKEDIMGYLVEDDNLCGWYSYIFHILAHILIFALVCAMLFEDNIVEAGKVFPVLVCVIICGITFFLPIVFRYSVSHFILHLGFGITFGLCAFFAQADVGSSILMAVCGVISVFSGSFMHKISHGLAGFLVGGLAVIGAISAIIVLLFTLLT